jgi:hypothetical protein
MDTHQGAAALARAVHRFAEALDNAGEKAEAVRLARDAENALLQVADLTEHRSPERTGLCNERAPAAWQGNAEPFQSRVGPSAGRQPISCPTRR